MLQYVIAALLQPDFPPACSKGKLLNFKVQLLEVYFKSK